MLPESIPRRVFWIIAILLSAFFAVRCNSATEAPPDTSQDEDAEAEDEHMDDAEEHMDEAHEGNVVRGGLLYDKWWAVPETGHEDEHEHDEHEGEGNAPTGDHPLWATQDTNTRSGDDTWRCKECHGWDYKGFEGAYAEGSSHFTGFVGVAQMSGQDPADIVAIMQGSTNPDHDFSEFMTEQDLNDLAAFLSESLIDPDDYLDGEASTGDAGNGEALFDNVCTLCHGPGGNAINFSSIDDPEFLGHLGADNPWEFFHKVRYGQPGWPMPSAIGNNWSPEDIADVLAYVQTFGTEPALSGGGPLYDSWWKGLGVDAPEEDQPLWATQSTNERSGSDTWRCKECHGWDYRGFEGAYSSGSHSTGFTGVADAASMTSDELLAWLDGTTNPDHDFSEVIPDYGLAALVDFMQNEMTLITDYVSDDGTVNGDPLAGQGLYEGTCAACHGIDGKTINFGGEDDPEYLGTVASDNPWEFFHKASFGQPGEPMPAGLALGWSMQDIADLLAYVQTLPTE